MKLNSATWLVGWDPLSLQEPKPHRPLTVSYPPAKKRDVNWKAPRKVHENALLEMFMKNKSTGHIFVHSRSLFFLLTLALVLDWLETKALGVLGIFGTMFELVSNCFEEWPLRKSCMDCACLLAWRSFLNSLEQHCFFGKSLALPVITLFKAPILDFKQCVAISSEPKQTREVPAFKMKLIKTHLQQRISSACAASLPTRPSGQKH